MILTPCRVRSSVVTDLLNISMNLSNSTAASIIFGIILSMGAQSALAVPATKVFLNGAPTPVFFNDGDSFRVLAGPHKGTRARMKGFNTLETYGPVHKWGGWHYKELYVNSKMGTLNARNGVWHCSSKTFERDGYGRILWHCPGLARDQVRRGYAHAMTVTDEAADAELLKAQADAMKNKRGMWALGTPEYVLTSLHSFDEPRAKKGKNYNRVVSTRDGHSAKWLHDEIYPECSEVCRTAHEVEQSLISSAAKKLIDEGHTALSSFDPARLERLVGDYARLGYWPKIKDSAEVQSLLEERLPPMREEGAFGNAAAEKESCNIYVKFKRRYGNTRAECLR